MYAAYNAKKQLVYAKTISQHDSGPYYCPLCDSQVFYRISTLGKGYFAHNHTCLKTGDPDVNRGESAHHQKGKLVLQKNLKAFYPQVELEYLLEVTRQFADVYVVHKNKHYVIEFQYSPISTKDLVQRSQAYANQVDSCIWLIDSDVLYRRNHLVWLAANLNWHPKLGYFLLALDVDKERLVFEIDISMLETNQSQQIFSVQPIKQLIELNPSEIIKESKKVTVPIKSKNYHYDRRIRTIQTNLVYRHVLVDWYHRGFNIGMIPRSILCQPIRCLVFKQPIWLVVGWLMTLLKDQQKKVTMNHLAEGMERLIQERKIELNPMPFIADQHQLIRQVISELVGFLGNG